MGEDWRGYGNDHDYIVAAVEFAYESDHLRLTFDLNMAENQDVFQHNCWSIHCIAEMSVAGLGFDDRGGYCSLGVVC